MLKHLFHISIRSIRRKPWLHATNLLGLSVGLAAFALIAYYYEYQTSFDKSHVKGFMLDDFYADYQASEQNLSALLSAFGSIAIILSLFVIVALTMMELGKHMKDLSNRKVLGAAFIDLLVKVGHGNLIRFLLASAIVIPLVFWLMQKWLGGYANKVELGLKHLAPPIMLAAILVLALLASSYKAFRENPVEYLKDK